MELIYLYIRKYGTVFSDEAFNFSSNYTAAFQNHQLTLWENKEAVKGYYGKNVNNKKKEENEERGEQEKT